MDEAVQKKLENFFSPYKKRAFKKGEVLIPAHENPISVYFLTSGSVRCYSISKQGKEQILTLFKAPSFIPMMWILGEIENKYYYEAIEQVDVYVGPKDDFMTFIKNKPDILLDLLTRMYRGTSGLLKRLEYLMNGTAYQKVIFTILNNAARFGKKTSDPKESSLRITHKEISSLSGLTKETISRQSRKLQKKGLIENVNNLITIKDVAQLERELATS